MEITPVFDPETETWFVVDSRIEAPTIRGLLAKLNNDTTVKDYYPEGYRAVRKPERPAVALKVPVPGFTPVKDARPRNHLDHNKVLELWQQGMASGLIAEKTGIPRGSVTRIAWNYRKIGDPRAIRRQPKKD